MLYFKVYTLAAVLMFGFTAESGDRGKRSSAVVGSGSSRPSPYRGPSGATGSCSGEMYEVNGQWVCDDPQVQRLLDQERQRAIDNCAAGGAGQSRADCELAYDRSQNQNQNQPVEAGSAIPEKDMWIDSCLSNTDNTEEDCRKNYAEMYESGDPKASAGQCPTGQILDSSTGLCRNDPNAGSTTTATAEPSQVDLCNQAQQQIMVDCDSESKGWMQELSGVTGVIDQVNASACSTISAVNSATHAALATFSYNCNSSYTNCKKACASQAASGGASLCDTYGKKGKDAEARAQQAMNQVAVSIKQCQAAFGGEGDPCSDPQYAGTIACKGVSPIQGATPVAVTGTGLQNSNPAGLSHSGMGSAGGEIGTSAGYGLDEESAPESEYKPQATKLGEEIGGAKGGGSVAAGDGGAGGAGGAGGGGSGENQSLGAKILSGFFGGGSGGGGGGGRGRGGGSGWRNLFGFGGSDKKEVKKGPDLRQFMPGAKYDPNRHRGIAGQYVGKDGISGPHANLWRLINNRYQYKRPTLLP